MSISLDAELSERVRAAAQRAGTTLSSWIADAAAVKLRRENLIEFVAEYEREHGAFTEEELEQSRKDLGL